MLVGKTFLGPEDDACPVCEANAALWQSGNKDVVSIRKRKMNYISNVLVVRDPKQAENDGKVMFFKYGVKIFGKLKDAIDPQFSDVLPMDPFDPDEGANFRLRITMKNGFRDYDKSSFDEPSAIGKEDVIDFLKQKEVNFESAVMYKSVSSDLSDLRDIFYDMLIFFSPQGIESLFENFPDFKQNNTRIAVFGNITAKAAEEHKLHIDVIAPAPGIPSMSMALDKYLQESNK